MAQPVAETLNCPKCSAPLHPAAGQNLALCVYCGTASRLGAGASPAAALPAAAEVAVVSPEHMDQLKALLAAGRRDEAVALYQQLMGCPAVDARSAIDSLGEQLTLKVIRAQGLSAFGWLLVLVSAVALPIMAGGLATRRLPPLVAWPALTFCALNLVVFGPAIARSLRFRAGRVAQARILQSARVGQVRVRGKVVHTMRLLVEVAPGTAEAFRTEMLVPARAESLAKAQAGNQIEVRYLPGRSDEVLFIRSLAPA